MGTAGRFLEAHPELRAARDGSAVWPQVKDRDRMPGPETDAYIVQGDIVGDEDDLYLDVLARGSARETTDPLARQLFEALPTELQAVVLLEVRRIDTGRP